MAGCHWLEGMGWVDASAKAATSALQTEATAPHAARRPDASAEIAAMVAYLAGPEAAFVTGASLTIDGGFTA